MENYWLVDQSRFSSEADPVDKVIPRDVAVMDVLNETRIAIKSDHVHMTKFDDPTSKVYRLIVGQIRELLKHCAVEFAKADEAGTFQRNDELILKPSGLSYEDEQSTIDSEGM